MLQIEIIMLDLHKSLGAGRRIVSYLGFADDHLICQDSLRNRVRVPRRLFKFVGVPGYESRMDDDGRVEIKVKGEWNKLGPLFVNDEPRRRSSKTGSSRVED